MSLRHPSLITRRILKPASLGLVGLVAGLLAGCSGVPSNIGLAANDTNWQTSSTYASATSELSPRSAVRSTHIHLCDGSPCSPRLSSEHVLRGPHRGL